MGVEESIDREKFGTFLAARRRELGLTQKELAEKLFVSDKAVSKWERGLSLPDVELLIPLAGCLGVTVTELLRGERVTGGQLDVAEAEELVGRALSLSAEERRQEDRRWRIVWCLSALLALLEVVLVIWRLGPELKGAGELLFMTEGLCLGFGVWCCWKMKGRLPAYYDENRINFYSDGVFRMNLPGVAFNNSNWPHIVRALRVWMTAVPVLFPPLFLLLAERWADGLLPVTLAASLGFFVPLMYVGRKYG